MATAKNAPKSQYGDVVARLQQIVESLESGDLSLEQSLERFAEGVQLVKQGEKLLSDAEKRIEQLLSEDGRTAPLEAGDAPPSAKAKARPKPVVDDDDDEEDVPF